MEPQVFPSPPSRRVVRSLASPEISLAEVRLSVRLAPHSLASGATLAPPPSVRLVAGSLDSVVTRLPASPSPPLAGGFLVKEEMGRSVDSLVVS